MYRTTFQLDLHFRTMWARRFSSRLSWMYAEPVGTMSGVAHKMTRHHPEVQYSPCPAKLHVSRNGEHTWIRPFGVSWLDHPYTT